MSNAAIIRHDGQQTNGVRALAKREEAGFTESEVDLIKTQIAPGVTDGELKLFLHVCKSRQLDPFSKQIYAIVRKQWNQDTREHEQKMTIMAGIDGFRLTAKRGGIEAIDEPEFEYDARLCSNANPLGIVKASVKVWRAGVSRPTVGVAYWDEYAQTKRDGSLMGLWGKMPRTMIAKCAEAQALRKAAPEELSGIYAPEEMDQANSEPRERAPQQQPQRAQAQHVELAPVAEQPIALTDAEAAFIRAQMDEAATIPDLKKIGAQIANTKMSAEQSKDLRAHYAKRQNKIKKTGREAAEAAARAQAGEASADSDPGEIEGEIHNAQFDE